MNDDSSKKIDELFNNFFLMLEENNLELDENGDIINKDTKEIVLLGEENE